jgi:hypothetical protein
MNVFWIAQAGGIFASSTSSPPSSAATLLAQIPTTPKRMTRDASYLYVTTTNSVVAVPSKA